jgi:hypothetical protein
MAKILRDHPELIQVEFKYFTARENTRKKEEEAATTTTEAGPSTIETLSGSSSELDWDFWNNLSSSDIDE